MSPQFALTPQTALQAQDLNYLTSVRVDATPRPTDPRHVELRGHVDDVIHEPVTVRVVVTHARALARDLQRVRVREQVEIDLLRRY